MCGIAGGVAIRSDARPSLERIQRMSELIAHRGPDGTGWWSSPDGACILAHRRLSVIDLETGAQPMQHVERPVTVVFNGEIYNYLEIRDQLTREGQRFETRSDTEVILGAYVARDLEFLEPLRGMFAIALWDATRRQLVLARDQIGKKPLYYAVEDGCLYFASTLEALRRTTDSRWTPNRAAISAYLTLGYVPAPLTVYDQAHKLEAGTSLCAGPGGIGSTRKFGTLPSELEPFDGTFDQACDETARLLTEAVRIRLRSDVPLGIFLSGGVDSSLVTAIATRECGVDLQTFSIGFSVDRYDESQHAAQVAQSLGAKHTVLRVDEDLLGLLPQFSLHSGEPLGDVSALPLWVLAELTRRHVTVALAGDGGDELFGGYVWYATAARLENVHALAGGARLRSTRQALASVVAGSGTSSALSGRIVRTLDALAPGTAASRFAHLRVLFSERDFARVMPAGGSYSDNFTRAISVFEAVGGDALRRMRAADMATYLADCLMPKVDVATMAHALEARAPLLDTVLADFALTLPQRYLIDRTGGKRVLRSLLARYVPRTLVERPKQGFTVPLDEWFRGPLSERLREIARSDALAALGLDLDGLASLRDEHARGQRNHGDRLFALLALDDWARRN